MVGLGERLAARGYQAHGLQLPGHAGALRELAEATWADWFAATHDETRKMLARCERVIVVGHSLGGALALAVAAAEPEVAGIVALCPPCHLQSRLAEAVGVLRHLVRYVPALRYDVGGSWVALAREQEPRL
jgi:carboxylesterase